MLRVTVSFCLWGRVQVVILLPETGVEGAQLLAERIRTRVNEGVVENIPFTISSGVGQFSTGEALEQFMHRVDEALYLAKESGRNRVEATL